MKKIGRFVMGAACLCFGIFFLSSLGTAAHNSEAPSDAEITDYSKNIFHSCPAEGDAGEQRGDPEQNRLKNRLEVPDQFESVTFKEIWSLKVPGNIERKFRQKWSEQARTMVAAQEQRAVSVEGYILQIKNAYPSSSNCHLKSDLDFNIWLGVSPDAPLAEAIKVTVTPRIRAQYPKWELKRLWLYSTNRVAVKISGWLFLNSDELPRVGDTPILWKIHPVLKIEIPEGQGWSEI